MQKLDIAFKFGAGRYIQEENALDLAGDEIVRFGKKAYILLGPTAKSIVEERLEKSLKNANVDYVYEVYTGYCTREKAAEFAEVAKDKGCDVIVGAGGGRIMDLCKAVAHNAGLPVVTIPTQAGTCACYTPMSVMYREDGGALGTAGGNFYHDYEVSAVIVDEGIMVHQPPRYAASGMLDAMAKFIEIQNGHPVIEFDTFNIELYTAYTMAVYIYKVLEDTCLKVYEDIKNHRLTKEVHDFLFINFAITGFISGSSKALGQTALAHEMYYCARMMYTKESLSFLHGEIVGTSLILQLFYNDTPEKIPAFKHFMETMNMPVTIDGLGIESTPENKRKIKDYLASTMFVDNTPENLDRLEKAVDAVSK